MGQTVSQEAHMPQEPTATIKCGITDVLSPMFTRQQHDYGQLCARIEMSTHECIEAYGHELGQKKCQDLIRDYTECATKDKQLMRIAVGISSNGTSFTDWKSFDYMLIILCRLFHFRPCRRNGLANGERESVRRDMHHHHHTTPLEHTRNYAGASFYQTIWKV